VGSSAGFSLGWDGGRAVRDPRSLLLKLNPNHYSSAWSTLDQKDDCTYTSEK
jgi:hypothetical protein